MNTKYIVVKIYEDDFGCEERPINYEPQVIVLLKDMDGNEWTCKQADAWLYDQNINEQDEVALKEGKLIKIF